MSDESSIKITAQLDKVSPLDLQNNQQRLLEEVVANCVYLSLSLFSSKLLFTHFSTHTNALTVAHMVAHT